MRGAIFYATKYGSTGQYARWIAEATGLPVFDIDATDAEPSDYEFLVLGSPIIYHKLLFDRWLRRNGNTIESRPTILFSVSGAGAGAKLDGWLAQSMPASTLTHVKHFALLGRQNPKELTLYDRIMLIIGGLKNPDRKAAREEMHGFEFMDKASIGPIVERIRQFQESEMTATTGDTAAQ